MLENGNVRHYLARDFDTDAVGSNADLAAQSKLGLRTQRRFGISDRHPAGLAADGTIAILRKTANLLAKLANGS